MTSIGRIQRTERHLLSLLLGHPLPQRRLRRPRFPCQHGCLSQLPSHPRCPSRPRKRSSQSRATSLSPSCSVVERGSRVRLRVPVATSASTSPHTTPNASPSQLWT